MCLGHIYVNGAELTKDVQRQFGYVEQNDLHCVTATVHEALEFSAHLRLPSSQLAVEAIDATLQILELEKERHRYIKDLSREQLKRVTIGVELVANPSVLLL